MKTSELLLELSKAYGPSGSEGEVREKIAELVKGLGVETSTDVMGNLICHKAGSGAKIMYSAHMDSIGLIATHFEDNGCVRFSNVGGIRAYNIVAMPVRFANGVCGCVAVDGDADYSKLTLSKMYIDIGAASAKEAEKMIKLGDVAVFDTPAKLIKAEKDEYVLAPYMDNRAGCAALIKAMEIAENTKNDVYYVFSTQEELGTRGAKTAVYAIDPQYAVVCDTTFSDDCPKAPHNGSCKCGDGAALKIMDATAICHPKMVQYFVELADKKKIKYQRDIIRGGGTDAGPMHLNKGGVLTGGVSVSTRYVHSPQEMVSVSDVEETAKLLAAFAEKKF